VIRLVIITTVTGILLGFAKSARTPADGIEDLTRNILVAMAGAFVGLQVVSGVFGSAEAGVSTFLSTIAAIAGAAVLLSIVIRVRRA